MRWQAAGAQGQCGYCRDESLLAAFEVLGVVSGGVCRTLV